VALDVAFLAAAIAIAIAAGTLAHSRSSSPLLWFSLVVCRRNEKMGKSFIFLLWATRE
jgi:hypothetical protein